jgi:hypothetical protein
MITLHEVEQLISFIEVLFDALRSARDFFKSLASKKSSHSIQIPTQTLILLPDARPYALRWGLGKNGAKELMQIDGEQATNTSPYAIRAAGVRLLKPKRVDIVFHMITVQAPRSAMHSAKNLIQAGCIGEIFFMFIVTPVTGMAGRPLRATISILDQFGNEHILRDLEFKFIGPEKIAVIEAANAPRHGA